MAAAGLDARHTELPEQQEPRFSMIADPSDQLKQQYTDKYVVVDAERPELARFRDVVGQVKTVNMSGRALVEFDDYHLNIGWYDIDPTFLKVVDKPPPKPKEPAAKKPAGEAASAAGKSAGKAAAKPAVAKAPAKAATGGKMSVAEMLAAARGGKPAAKTQTEAASSAPVPKATAAPPAKADGPKMTVEQMLAAARAGATASKPAAKTAPPPEPAGEPASAGGEAAAAPAKKPSTTGKVDRSTMSVADMLAWCREHDAK